MNIGIIGAGNIGGSLGKVWGAKGHTIRLGARDPGSAKTQQALESIPGAVAVSPAEAASASEVIVLAVPWNAVRESLAQMGDLRGKVIIDATNRFGAEPGDAPSAAEDVARAAPGAFVVKAFNTMGWETLLNPVFNGHPATAFVCGDSAQAKATVSQLAAEIGLSPVDAGPLSNAAAVEGLARLWVSMMRAGGSRDIAFVLMRR